MQDSWLSILGSVASIGAAIWAYIEAKSASRHASKAEAIRDELIQRRSRVEVSQVHAKPRRPVNSDFRRDVACKSHLVTSSIQWPR